MKNFALFYACPMLMIRDPKLDKFVPFTMNDLMPIVADFFISLMTVSTLLSLFNYFPDFFPALAQGNLRSDEEWYNWSTLFYPPKWLVRNLLIGTFLQQFIQCFGAGLTAAQGLVTGNKTGVTMDNPMSSSRSVGEMWGSKWNVVIHDALKLGVYLPARKVVPKVVAMFSTFVASGLFHEAIIQMFTWPLDNIDGCLSDPVAKATKVDCFRPRLFTTTWMFVWNAFLVGMEQSPLGKFSFWSKVPNAVCALYVTAMAGCLFCDWFMEPYWNSLCIENSSILFFVMKPVAK